jgi:hypothetical protein
MTDPSFKECLSSLGKEEKEEAKSLPRGCYAFTLQAKELILQNDSAGRRI